MTWSLYRWVWLLESPLFVGAAPAGTLNRCRPYVLARGIWAALTSEMAQTGANGFPAYWERGKILRDSARFTYLYPASSVGGAWRAWLPEYVRNSGLVWHREDQPGTADAVCDRPFRRCLIDTRAGTAIDADSDTAAERTLRETECVMTYWRAGSGGGHDRVGFAGYVFFKDIPKAELDPVTTLFVGGDTRYGLGRMRRIEFRAADTVFGQQPLLDKDLPVLTSSCLLAHGSSARSLAGAKEALTRWDRTTESRYLSVDKLRWTPGSRLHADASWMIDQDGMWNDLP